MLSKCLAVYHFFFITSVTIFSIISTTVFFQHLGIFILVIDVSMKYVAVTTFG